MTGIAVLAPQHLAIDAQARADAGAPGHIGTVIHALQRAPAALGLQRGNAVVFYPNARKGLAQRRFKQGGSPVIGQAARRPRQTAANIGRSQLDLPLVQHERATRCHTHRRDVVRPDMRRLATGTNHPQHLLRQRIWRALLARRLDLLAVHAARVHDIDGHFGAANVHARHGRSTGGQAIRHRGLSR